MTINQRNVNQGQSMPIIDQAIQYIACQTMPINGQSMLKQCHSMQVQSMIKQCQSMSSNVAWHCLAIMVINGQSIPIIGNQWSIIDQAMSIKVKQCQSSSSNSIQCQSW